MEPPSSGISLPLELRKLVVETILSIVLSRVIDPMIGYLQNWLFSAPLKPFQILPSFDLTGVVALVLAFILVFGAFYLADRGMGPKRIVGVQAHIFFPTGTPEHDKTLDYHKKNFHHKLMVNYKTKPPTAYYMSTASYGWKLINKYPDLWVSENDPSPHDDNFTRKWSEEKGYKLIPKNADERDLLEKDESRTSDSSKAVVRLENTEDVKAEDIKGVGKWDSVVIDKGGKRTKLRRIEGMEEVSPKEGGREDTDQGEKD